MAACASRGEGARGFVDFVGVDIDGGLHVVETKIGPDHMLGLQGIDYWAWVTAHRGEKSPARGRVRTLDGPARPVALRRRLQSEVAVPCGCRRDHSPHSR
ncbi:MAG: hypothetical protein U5Q44_02375 [Dehalococcoidia bacterium]|nr:hypothetical protein [Dehalococcoidia bacterium]